MNNDRYEDDRLDERWARAAAIEAAEVAAGVAAAALTVLALAALLSNSLRAVGEVRQRRRGAPQPRLQTWENEGGRPRTGEPMRSADGTADLAP